MIASESEPKPGYAHHRGIPYGYAVQRDGSVAADEDEQAVLLRLQLWREAGYSYSVIAASLNAAGFRTRAESGWTKFVCSFFPFGCGLLSRQSSQDCQPLEPVLY